MADVQQCIPGGWTDSYVSEFFQNLCWLKLGGPRYALLNWKKKKYIFLDMAAISKLIQVKKMQEKKASFSQPRSYVEVLLDQEDQIMEQITQAKFQFDI